MTSSYDVALDELSLAMKHFTITTVDSSPVPTTTTTTTTTTTSSPSEKTESQAAPNNQQKQQKKKKKKQLLQQEKKESATESPLAKYNRWEVIQDESKLDYGYVAQLSADEPIQKDCYYITTAINYTNGPAHMGHAYEGATADCIARYARLKYGSGGCYFLTGSDEHGQKIANTAEAMNQAPIEICDKYVTGFQCLNQRILVSNDDYLRTTSERHKATAQVLWRKCAANTSNHEEGDIYLDAYSGWYNVREETFVTDTEAEASEFKDPSSGLPLKRVEEESYFFRMSAYHDRLVEYIEQHPEFIMPGKHRNLILSRLRSDRLRDLSISRTTFSWGIQVPQPEFKSNHVMYVWFDALSNYLTGIDALGLNQEKENLRHVWPADVHIIGKDILWFHTVIWPCILMSAGMSLPKTVFAHGFVNDEEGKKMSKSLGNVVDPHDMLDKYPVDTFRWYLCCEAPYGGELNFNPDSLMNRHNSDLCDTLGNLVHRTTNLCKKYCNGTVPDVENIICSNCIDGKESTFPGVIDFEKVRSEFLSKMDSFELEAGASLAIAEFRNVNGYLTEKSPWHLKGDEHTVTRQVIVRATLEAVYALSHLLLPFIPAGAKKIFDKLGTPPKTPLTDLKGSLRNLSPGVTVNIGDVLYSKIATEEELNAAEAAKKKATDYAEAQKRKKEKKAQNKKASQAGMGKSGSDENQPDFTKIDIRVGLITKVWLHPDADKLFCEEIDVGEDEPRQIASGLRGHYELSEMEDRKVLVVCNLKAANIVGFKSFGMVLAAKAENNVELVIPPEGASIGERVYVDGLSGEPITSAQVKKKKVWETVSSKLRSNGKMEATWDGQVIMTSAGVCSIPSLENAPIS